MYTQGVYNCYYGNGRWLLDNIPYWDTVSIVGHQVIMDHVILCLCICDLLGCHGDCQGLCDSLGDVRITMAAVTKVLGSIISLTS